jgi:DNA-binding XRE family transcriptional regulator
MSTHKALLSKMKGLQRRLNSLDTDRRVLELEYAKSSGELGKLLRVHRVELRLKQKTASRKLEISQCKLSRIESGDVVAFLSEAEKIAALIERRSVK